MYLNPPFSLEPSGRAALGTEIHQALEDLLRAAVVHYVERPLRPLTKRQRLANARAYTKRRRLRLRYKYTAKEIEARRVARLAHLEKKRRRARGKK